MKNSNDKKFKWGKIQIMKNLIIKLIEWRKATST